MKTQTYFKITINARSQEELEMRIADSESRGFEVVGRYQNEKEVRDVTGTNYKGSDGKYRRQIRSSSYKTYICVMRRKDNGR